ncbi:MAG TPA: sorbosone dehydrogenase family protein [Pirellulaceae bacterium]|jgi:glucose/arabinose dehydrogenase|nr:sorbosone dehydrogenase family protein [Pirellulaceae bacterium]
MRYRNQWAAATLLAACFGGSGALLAQENGGDQTILLPEVQTKAFEPEPIKIEVADLPAPNETESANKHPEVVKPPETPTLEAPEGFQVAAFAAIDQARWLTIGPRGELICVASKNDTVWVLEDGDGDGVAEIQYSLLDSSNGAHLPFGVAFDDEHFYLGNTNAVLKYPYAYGKAEDREFLTLGEPQKIADLPGQGYNQHWTRNVILSKDGEKLFVSVGSESNADIEEAPRATVLVMNKDGSDRKVYASGLRNPVGLDVHPKTGVLFAAVNERDKIGDELVPDYLTNVKEGGFYGWPYSYFKPTLLDPRHVKDGKSVRPELVEKTIMPDVLFEAHSAALGLAFYDGDAFPEPYRDGAFVAMRGSWNRSRGTGYKIAYVPFENDKPVGHYQDFVRGFLIEPEVPKAWGRPVGVAVGRDGSLFFTEEGNGYVYRVSYKK